VNQEHNHHYIKEDIKKIVQETIHDLLNPGHKEFEQVFFTLYNRIFTNELKEIIQEATHKNFLELTPKLEDEIYHRVISDLKKRGYFEAPSSVMCMIVSTGKEIPGKKSIKRRISNARELIICDPYIFYNHLIAENEYINQIISILPIKNLQELTIFCKLPRSSTIINKFNKELPPNVLCQIYKVDDVHDRVWIKDSSKGFIVGTSFGGIGKKITFILNLPKRDLEEFLQLLVEIKSYSEPING
jgi:hypothetical protein